MSDDVATAEAPARDGSGRWLPGCKSPNQQGGAIASYPRDWRELRDLAQSHAPEAINKILDIMRTAKSKKLQMAAACVILDRGFGKPQLTVDMSENPLLPSAYWSRFERARRIAYLLREGMRANQGIEANGANLIGADVLETHAKETVAEATAADAGNGATPPPP